MRYDLGLSEAEINRITWYDINKLFERHRAKLRFLASVNGAELNEDEPPRHFEPVPETASEIEDRIAYLDAWVKRTGGTSVKDGESPTTRSEGTHR